jgi:hypothetical protein
VPAVVRVTILRPVFQFVVARMLAVSDPVHGLVPCTSPLALMWLAFTVPVHRPALYSAR